MSEGQIVKEFDVHSYVMYMQDKYSAYDNWVADQGVPIVSGAFIADAREVPVAPWKAKGALGTILQFADQRAADAYVLEIPAEGSTTTQRQLFEEIVVILEGNGSTEMWYSDGPRRSFEWQRGSVFSVPINAFHAHHNGSGENRVRYVALTSAPPVIEAFRDLSFVFDNDHVFVDRFDAEDPAFFDKPDEYLTDYYGGILDSNFISDIRKVRLVPREKRGTGNKNMYIHIAGSTMFAHVSRFPVGTYKKAHRHGPGAHIVMLDSTGYTMMWKGEDEEPVRYDWAEGSVISPAAGMWHQHYNTGTKPCKFVALHASVAFSGDGGGDVEQLEGSVLNEDLAELYRSECAKNGVEVSV